MTCGVPGVRVEWRTTAGAEAHGSRTVRTRGSERCEVTLEVHVVPRGVDRLLSPLLRKMIAENLHRDLERLADIVQDRVGAAS